MENPRLKVVNQKTQSRFKLAPELLLKMHDLMVRTRIVEERLIKMYKQNDGFFWIGGPGEEAFNIPLGLLIKKGQGPKFDYFHGHYRSAGVLLAMGAEPIGFFRQMKNTVNDPFSGGRNFCGHLSISKWNVAPISSPIEVQFSIAPGTAIANKRESDDAISIVVGGDAGSAEGDFATCMVWSSRPANPLPLLMLVTNNRWGISTSSDPQHGEKHVSDRAKAFQMPTRVIDGNDPEECYLALKEAMDYCRTERKPYMLEAYVSRLYGHSSASGANFITQEDDPVRVFEEKLIKENLITKKEVERIWEKYNEEMLKMAQQVRHEPQPDPESIWDKIFHGQVGKKGKYGGE